MPPTTGEDAHVSTANPNFDLTALLQATLLLEGESLDASDDLEGLFSLSPLSSPENTPPPSPRPQNEQQLPVENQTTDGGSGTPPRSDADRKARWRAKSHTNCRNKRQQERDMNFGHYQNRPAVQEKYVDNAVPIKTSVTVGQGSVASTGYVGLDIHGRSDELFELEELVGEESTYRFKLERWDGRTTKSIVDQEDRSYVFLAGHPEDDDWPQLAQEAANALEERRSRCSVPEEKCNHRRGAFLALNCGPSYGGGRQQPTNFVHNKANTKVLEELNGLRPFKRLAGFASSVLSSRAPKLYDYYVDKLGRLFSHHPSLKRNFTSSVFAAAAYNFGPRTICYRHTDFANLPFGMCAITALGSFDPTKGGHLVLWDAHLVIEFPPGSTILIPSAILAHLNVAIGEGETRYSFTQYSAGGLFRWVDNDYKTAKKYLASLKPQEKAAVDKKNSERWLFGLSLFPKAKRPTSPPSL